jgi:hypothetical protein
VDSYANPFFEKNEKTGISSGILEEVSSSSRGFYWLISADKIFASSIDEYAEYAKFYFLEFSVSRFSLFDGAKSSDSAVCSRDVKIYMPPSGACAIIQSNLANGKEVSKIITKKVSSLSGKREALEEMEFTKCIIQSFERRDELVTFTFRYTSYSDSYQDFNSDGTKSGKSAVNVDLTTWEVK